VALRHPFDPLPLNEAVAVLALLMAGGSGALLTLARQRPSTFEVSTGPGWEDIVATLAPALAAIDPVVQAQEAAVASRRLTGAAGAVVGLVDADQREIRLVAEGSWPPEPLTGRSLGARSIASGAPQLNRSGVGLAGLPQWGLGLPVRDFWALPLIVQGEGIGVLYLWDEEDTSFSLTDLGWFLPAVGSAVSLRSALRVRQMLTQECGCQSTGTELAGGA
jgi:hypothetical protein